jgi:hypothetical protein
MKTKALIVNSFGVVFASLLFSSMSDAAPQRQAGVFECLKGSTTKPVPPERGPIRPPILPPIRPK